MKTTYAILAGLVAQQAAATSWDVAGPPFLTPQYANNECSVKQKPGFNWSDLKVGQNVGQYGDFDFSQGWKCSNTPGKRDALTKRGLSGKSVSNRCSHSKPASFGCGNKKKDGFSINTIDVSVEFDVLVDLHYTLVDGSLCKQIAVPCKQSGNTIANTQCGGAKTVEIFISSSFSFTETVSDCGINMHHIGFDCSPPRPFTTPPQPSPPPATSSPPPTSSPMSTPAAVTTNTTSTPSGIYYMPPFRNSSVAALSSIFPTTIVSTSSTAVSVAASSAAGYGPMYSSSAQPPPSVDQILPSCMNTWLQITTSCRDNTHADCYCTNANFTTNVIQCVESRCDTPESVKQTLQYLVGICAQHVSQNPSIISNCPNGTFEVSPPPPLPSDSVSTPGPASSTPTTPVTTITYGSTCVTVPLVYFTTTPVGAGSTPTNPVGLQPGNTPPPTPAAITISAGGPATTYNPPTGTGSLRPTTSLPSQFTGGATPLGAEANLALIGAALAWFAL
ncbi:hypothetical protein ACEQ8H_007646 [Pleosporales sp. CAS-2024a]